MSDLPTLRLDRNPLAEPLEQPIGPRTGGDDDAVRLDTSIAQHCDPVTLRRGFERRLPREDPPSEPFDGVQQTLTQHPTVDPGAPRDMEALEAGSEWREELLRSGSGYPRHLACEARVTDASDFEVSGTGH